MKKNIIIAIVIIAVLICIGFFIYKTNNKNKITKSINSTNTSTNTKKDTYQMPSTFQTKQSMKQFTTN